MPSARWRWPTSNEAYSRKHWMGRSWRRWTRADYRQPPSASDGGEVNVIDVNRNDRADSRFQQRRTGRIERRVGITRQPRFRRIIGACHVHLLRPFDVALEIQRFDDTIHGFAYKTISLGRKSGRRRSIGHRAILE